MSGRRVLAVDGGNSKTDLALVRDDGRLLAHVRGPLSSPHHLGLEEELLFFLVAERSSGGGRASFGLLSGEQHGEDERLEHDFCMRPAGAPRQLDLGPMAPGDAGVS